MPALGKRSGGQYTFLGFGIYTVEDTIGTTIQQSDTIIVSRVSTDRVTVRM